MKKILLLAFLTCILNACKSDGTSKQKVSTPAPTPQVTNNIAAGLPPLPVKELVKLYQNSTYVDYIFHELPFSVSQSNPTAIQANIAMIAQQSPAEVSATCPSLGREFFHIEGDIVWEAEVYFDQSRGCQAYIFYKDKKPQYANGISESGVKFYQNLINQNFGTPSK